MFGRDAKRVLDIGFGDGEALVTNAVNNPGVDYVGIEVHEPGIGHLLLLLEQAAATNVRIIAHDAADVVPQLMPDAIVRRRRFVLSRIRGRRSATTSAGSCSRRFVAEVARVLEAGGFLHVATDWADYARHTREVLAQSTELHAGRGSGPVRQSARSRPPTKFERRGRRLGHDVVDLYYRKP